MRAANDASGLDPAAIDRFKAAFLHLAGGDLTGGELVALAVSGGPDSMAMLALAAAALPGQVIAATVDHGLRVESADEANMVGNWCACHDVVHTTLRIEASPSATGNLQSWARQERYALLRRWAVASGSSVLCTAHHADDQAETFLMRAARGAGIAGLSSVRERQEVTFFTKVTWSEQHPGGFQAREAKLWLLRPLLRWRRSELRQLVEEGRIPFVLDPSNQDSRFERTRMREWLASAPWFDPKQVGKSAGHVAEAEADLREISHWFWTERGLPCDSFEARVDVAGLPRGVRRYLVRLAIDYVMTMLGMQPGGPDQIGNVESMLNALEAGSGATLHDIQASAKGSVWHFREAPPRRSI